jgi:hypothetical protein
MMNTTKAVLGLAGALLLFGSGAGMGAALTPGPAAVVREVTPQSCIDALDRISDVLGLAEGYPYLAADAVRAVSARDTDWLDATTVKMNSLNKEITDAGPGVGVPVKACRAGAK